jgi:hypothetical protein
LGDPLAASQRQPWLPPAAGVPAQLVGLLALIAQGCTKKPESYSLTSKPGYYPMASFRSDYRSWNCQELADEADLLKDALTVASEQRAGDKVAHLKAETEAVHEARTLKKCSA